MKAVILAAGRGSRAASAACAKPLLRIQGLALLERSIATAMRAGIDDFVVVTGYAAQQVADLALEVSRKRRVTISVVDNTDWTRGNASSLLAARELLHEPFLLLMADHILDERILQRLVEHGLRDDALVLAIDRSDPATSEIDLDDVTRVGLSGHRIERIGKGLAEYDAFDTGAFLCSSAVFTAVEDAVESGDGSISGAVQRLAVDGRAGVLDVTGLQWMDVDTPTDMSQASTRLTTTVTGKSRDGWVSRVLNRPVSTHLTTPLLLRLFPSITANQASAVSAIFGALATVCFVLHLPGAGAMLTHAASVLDGTDGEIARLKRLDSPFGGFFDALLDRYTDSLIMLGLFYFVLTSESVRDVLGRASEPIILSAGMLAVSGTWLVSYTTTKASADLGHRYHGAWIGSGRGRDIRLLIVTVAGLAAVVYPVAALAALAAIAVLTHAIVLRRLQLSWKQATGQTDIARIEAIVYDLDGTLVDSMPALSGLATALIQQWFGLDPATARERYAATTGADFATQLEELFPGNPANSLVAAEFEAAKRELMTQVEPFADARWAVDFFASRGLSQFVCSSSQEDLVRATLEQSGFVSSLEAYGGFSAGFDKGSQLTHLLQTHRRRPETTLFVGDSLRDAAYARRAGTLFLGLTRSFTEAEFRRVGAEGVQDLRVLATQWDAAVRSVVSLGGSPPLLPRPSAPELDLTPILSFPRETGGLVEVPLARREGTGDQGKQKAISTRRRPATLQAALVALVARGNRARHGRDGALGDRGGNIVERADDHLSGW
jgi:1L-myo-inositol 1-phosphate cytidylyltransferase / CDP-L-myo-inositol myo-inositolphosphotransferase